MCASIGWISAKALSSAPSSLWADLAPRLAESTDNRFADNAYVPTATSPSTESVLSVLNLPSCRRPPGSARPGCVARPAVLDFNRSLHKGQPQDPTLVDGVMSCHVADCR